MIVKRVVIIFEKNSLRKFIEFC